jgi:hypothetical protein
VHALSQAVSCLRKSAFALDFDSTLQGYISAYILPTPIYKVHGLPENMYILAYLSCLLAKPFHKYVNDKNIMLFKHRRDVLWANRSFILIMLFGYTKDKRLILIYKCIGLES